MISFIRQESAFKIFSIEMSMQTSVNYLSAYTLPKAYFSDMSNEATLHGIIQR